MLPPYEKPHLGFPEQLALLKARGLHVDDEPRALRYLERIGYYRLKNYFYPFRQSRRREVDGKPRYDILEDFREGAEFKHAVQLYVFDKRLRLLMLDAIERIEVAMRVDLAHTLGLRDQAAHRTLRHLDPRRASQIRLDGRTRHDQWLGRAADEERRSKADWVAEFRSKYSSDLPIWMAVELWDFGVLSHLLEIAHPVDRAAIARKYDLPTPDLLVSWIKSLAYVRNICAHHDRLWNQPLVNQPMIPKGQTVPNVSHLRTHVLMQTRVYASATTAQHFLGVVNPTSTWKLRLRALWADFPIIPGIATSQAGFMQNWGAAQIWQ